ncbi:RING-type E3 ubiquitin transferase [Quillaja saponaria]|uniref:U-box domain-containing protein n=1 Tax=Quillaja saponaria TaxID=32244 RepID=A0AAD7LUB5_QUISA|nr:RING-type E3 ubiquitin transferase [Quillaja saponaria]
MVLSWTRRRAFGRTNKKDQLSGSNVDTDMVIPTHFRCPISLDLMKDPVTLSTGITYDRESIEKWIESGNQTCPVTNQVLKSFDQIPNHAIRRMIQDWCVQNQSYGIERIPTPRIPVAPYVVSEILSRMTSAAQHGDDNKCQEMVGKIKAWGKESERNKRCVVDNGAGFVLANAFDSFSKISIEKYVGLLEEILGVLTWMLPLGEEGLSKLGSVGSLRCMVWFLNGKDLSARKNSGLVLKEVVCSGNFHVVDGLVRTGGVFEALVKMIREPIGPTATKACLTTIFHMISSNERIKSKLVELGLVSLLLEIVVDSERSICEKALGVLDGICDCKEGKEIAKRNALTVPLMVKKILRVSELASEFSVSILWKLSNKGKKGEEGVLIEAVQVGAFQKVLVMLQVGCGGSTKEKATELLKLLNIYRDRVECVDSSLELKYLKKPF